MLLCHSRLNGWRDVLKRADALKKEEEKRRGEEEELRTLRTTPFNHFTPLQQLASSSSAGKRKKRLPRTASRPCLVLGVACGVHGLVPVFNALPGFTVDTCSCLGFGGFLDEFHTTGLARFARGNLDFPRAPCFWHPLVRCWPCPRSRRKFGVSWRQLHDFMSMAPCVWQLFVRCLFRLLAGGVQESGGR